MVNETKKSKKHKRNKKKNKAKNLSNTEQAENFSEEDQNAQEVEDTEPQHDDSDGEHEQSRKRDHVEDSDSDTEDKPKKKKKKNKPVPESTGDKKGKKSIRQMKREKHAQRQAEAQAASKDQLKTQCLSYLSQWKHDKPNWKFMKAKQVWLFKNKFSPTLVPDASWPLLLEYFESAQGNIRKLLLDDANKIIKQKDEWLEAQNGKEEKEPDSDEEVAENPDGPKKPDETSYKRARDLIQCLQE
ncbi:hypothetical protein NE865_02596 [Phthorimaea operculella]|nr:hypothetical protein NE865_02596 [Phthorimaea operculella]